MSHRGIKVASVLTTMLVAPGAAADIVYYGDGEQGAWQQAAGSWQTITFQEFPIGTWLRGQYLPTHGLEFADPTPPQIIDDPGFINDGVGMSTISDPALIEFEEVRHSLAFEYQGHLRITLYLDGEPIAPFQQWIHSGVDHFSGLVSDVPFNGVRLEDPTDQRLFIDDMYFGSAVPAPGAWVLLGLGAMGRRRRR